MFSTRKKLLFFIALTGTAVKLAEFLLWYGSTFRFYNLVPGLDMKTLLSFSEWGTPGNGFFLTPHRALVAAWWKLNGSTHFIPGIVAVQALCGILGATLCADLALRLFDRDRTAAIVCGLAYLLYGPFFIYEFSVLQETTALTLILFAFHAALRARGVRRCALAGAVLGLSVVGRPIALPLASFLCLLILKREVRQERTTFKDAEVRAAMENMIFVKIHADRTKDPETAALMKLFDVPGLPAYRIIRPGDK